MAREYMIYDLNNLTGWRKKIKESLLDNNHIRIFEKTLYTCIWDLPAMPLLLPEPRREVLASPSGGRAKLLTGNP